MPHATFPGNGWVSKKMIMQRDTLEQFNVIPSHCSPGSLALLQQSQRQDSKVDMPKVPKAKGSDAFALDTGERRGALVSTSDLEATSPELGTPAEMTSQRGTAAIKQSLNAASSEKFSEKYPHLRR